MPPSMIMLLANVAHYKDESNEQGNQYYYIVNPLQIELSKISALGVSPESSSFHRYRQLFCFQHISIYHRKSQTSIHHHLFSPRHLF